MFRQSRIAMMLGAFFSSVGTSITEAMEPRRTVPTQPSGKARIFRSRVPGPARPAGSKLARKAREGQLGLIRQRSVIAPHGIRC